MSAYINALVQEGKLRRFRNLNISFSDSLVKRNSRRTRDIIASPEAQELWSCQFGVKQADEWEIINAAGRSVGQTVSRAGGGQITGGRGGYPGPEFSGFMLAGGMGLSFDHVVIPAMISEDYIERLSESGTL